MVRDIPGAGEVLARVVEETFEAVDYVGAYVRPFTL